MKNQWLFIAAPSGTATPSNDETANGAITPKKAEVDPLEAPLKGSPLSHGQFQLFGLPALCS
ncbi:hypothetical protein V1517DRAFT_326140 [Lipomyces orientalis]|uniref:Uncharacterized protein n=1 Tax=Lipomyces orientalis TaxID=1233043 RepID=A0ACC3TL95_9ASCO